VADIIFTKRLRREYASTAAVDNVDLAVEEGSVAALVGPNGAGKTTFLKMIAALLEPTSGLAMVAGHEVTESPRGVHAAVGYLPDFFGLYEELTARQCLRYFQLAYRLPEPSDLRIEEVLELVNLRDAADRPIESLSRGMRQRLGLARTLLHDPKLLLLDEPASGLDPGARRELQDLLWLLASMGKTIVVSSHILTELEDYCSHVIMLDRGRLVFSGTVAEARQRAGGGRRLRLRVAGPPEAALAALTSDPEVSEALAAPDGWAFRFSGDDESAERLLRSLVTAGVRVCSFADDSGSISDGYMKMMPRDGA
jgi:ABC-2 type transport system ATP-binding protein